VSDEDMVGVSFRGIRKHSSRGTEALMPELMVSRADRRPCLLRHY
jgi:hypothetical protein